MTQDFNYEEELSKCKTMQDITGQDGLVQKIIKDAVEHVLGMEMEDYILKEKEKGGSVTRNGTSHKNIKTAYGNIGIQVPRTREAGFEPDIIKKRAVIEEGLEPQVISMYAKGMTVRDISEHMQALYGIELSAASISNITEKISGEAKEWYSRTLESFYPVVFLDAVHFKVREKGRIVTKAAYVALGINGEGYKDILGIWIGENEGAKFWLKVCNELKNRGVEDILIVCIDGLKGFPDAVHTVFPQTRIQLCIIHQIRSTIKYVSYKDQRAFLADLKKVYGAESEEIALGNLESMQDTWKKYAAVLDNWLAKWDSLSTYFCYGYRIRRLIYTTNTIEGFNCQLRKVTKNKAVFPNDDALRKTLYLCTADIVKKWSMPYRDWGETYGQFVIEFGDRAKIA
ncbi:MAG: IS256 family transposase [Lachnospiraceae bacterium]|nr:IS256 family transposase [Lachnospiraceae bacterium]